MNYPTLHKGLLAFVVRMLIAHLFGFHLLHSLLQVFMFQNRLSGPSNSHRTAHFRLSSMTTNSGTKQEPVSFEELQASPTTDSSPPPLPARRRPELPPLMTDLPRVSHPFINPPQLQADILYNRSAENSPSQSRGYIKAGLGVSFADFHDHLARTDAEDDGGNSSAEHSQSYSRRYIRAGFGVSFTDFHRDLARTDTEDDRDKNDGDDDNDDEDEDDATLGLIKQEISQSTASTRSPAYSPDCDVEWWVDGFFTESPDDMYGDPRRRHPSDLIRWVVHGIPLPALRRIESSDDSPGGVHLRNGRWSSENLSPGWQLLKSDESSSDDSIDDRALLASSDTSVDGGVLLDPI